MLATVILHLSTTVFIKFHITIMLVIYFLKFVHLIMIEIQKNIAQTQEKQNKIKYMIIYTQNCK